MSETQDLYKLKSTGANLEAPLFPVPGIKGVKAPYPGKWHIVSHPRRRNWSSWDLFIDLDLPFGVELWSRWTTKQQVGSEVGGTHNNNNN